MSNEVLPIATEAVDELASAVGSSLTSPISYRNLPSYSQYRYGHHGAAALAISLVISPAFLIAFASSDVFTSGSSHGLRSFTGSVFIFGKAWYLGLAPLIIWSGSLITVILRACFKSRKLPPLLRIQARLMFPLCTLGTILPAAIHMIAILAPWGGIYLVFRSGLYLWLCTLWTMFIAMKISSLDVRRTAKPLS
jgi:hypothetical protein